MVEKPEILIFREVSVSHGCNQVSGVLAMPFPEARCAVLKIKRIGYAVLQTSFMLYQALYDQETSCNF